MKQLVAICFCLTLFFPCRSQGYDPSKISKKATSLFNSAFEKIHAGQHNEALALLQNALNKEPGYLDAMMLMASIYREEKKYDSSVIFYARAFQLDSAYIRDYKLNYATALAGKGDFQQALDIVNTVLGAERLNPNTRKLAEARKKNFEFAVKSGVHPEYQFNPQNCGDAINSPESEYFPSITIDNSEFVFTRNVKGRNEDFFISHNQDGKWMPAQAMSGNVNTPENEGAQMISQDGEWLVFTGCNRRDGMGSCDIYISFLEKNGWSPAENMGSEINSEFWDSQPCLSPDKKDLYFASRRPGGYGGSDLYVSHLQPNGHWSAPENLGPEINTEGDEQCPFIHADNQTLYFTSDGLPGYGNKDLFYTRKKNNAEWITPVNLGYPINTIDEEGTLFIAADGKTAYYTSDRSDSRGGLDIYQFELRKELRPQKTLYVKGRVLDAKTKQGLASSVQLVDVDTRQQFSDILTDTDGNYLVTLPTGRNYAFSVNKKGYLFYSEHFLLTGETGDSAYRKDIPLQPIEVNAAIVLQNIFFDINKADLKPSSQVELDKIVQLLKDNPALRIEISGHTDDQGKPADNLLLSKNRAQAVVDYLTSKGIPASRLSAKGYGETKPVADNKTEEGRTLNRRTEMKVIGQ